jgi:hypothetical protein
LLLFASLLHAQPYTPLGSFAKNGGEPSPWPVTHVTLAAGDTLLVSSTSWGLLNRATWNGVPMQVCSEAAGVFDAGILCLYSSTGGTGDLLIDTPSSNAGALAVGKLSGARGVVDARSRSFGSFTGPPMSDAPAQTNYASEFGIAVLGISYSPQYFRFGAFKDGWKECDRATSSAFILLVACKVFTSLEASQASYSTPDFVSWEMTHASFPLGAAQSVQSCTMLCTQGGLLYCC